MFKKVFSILFSFVFLMSAVGVFAVESRSIELDSNQTHVPIDSNGPVMGYYYHYSAYGVPTGQLTGNYRIYAHNVWWDYVKSDFTEDDFLKQWISGDYQTSFSQARHMNSYGYDRHDY